MSMSHTDLPRLSAHIERTGSPAGFVPAARKKRKNEESLLQQRVVAWWDANAGRFDLDPRDLHAVPNGAMYGIGLSRVIRAKTLLREGLRPGYPDLAMDVARGGFHGLRIEMKLPHTGPDDGQKAYHVLLMKRGYFVAVARTFDEAVGVITDYLK